MTQMSSPSTPSLIDPPRPGQVYRIPPASGTAFRLDRGHTLRVIDPTGQQVCDLFAAMASDVGEVYSGGRSIDYANHLYLTTGDTLYSNRSTPMLRITRDDVGRHDAVLTPCSPEMFVKLFGDDGTHPSCFANLAGPMGHFGCDPDRIGSTFNIFMDVRFEGDRGKMVIGPPASRAGDAIEFEALADLIVGLTACSSENSNASALKPIDFEVLP
jgi:uncharacterized protein